MNIYQFLSSSGIWGYPLLLLSMISVAVIVDRTVWLIYMTCVNRPPDLERLSRALRNGEKITGAAGSGFFKGICGENDDMSDPVAVENIKISTQDEWDGYFSRFRILDYIVTVAPLVGILGTITGIIKSFQALGEYSAAGQSLLTGGISEALTTTAAGLVISVFTLTLTSLLRWRGTRFFRPYEKAVTLMESSIGTDIIKVKN